jgi:hypothetical protein
MKWKALVASLLISTQVSVHVSAAVNRKTIEAKDIEPIPPVQTIPPGEDKIVPVRLGEPAPFSGQLYDPQTALRWAFWLQQWKGRYQLDLAQTRNLCTVELTYADEVRAAEHGRALRVEADLQQRLLRSEGARVKLEDSLRDPSFFTSPGFYYALGVVTAGVMVGLSVWAVDAAQ